MHKKYGALTILFFYVAKHLHAILRQILAAAMILAHREFQPILG
jgi:hypothetical protein